MAYSAILELVGLRHLADNKTDKYLNKIHSVVNFIETCLQEIKDDEFTEEFHLRYSVENYFFQFDGGKAEKVLLFFRKLRHKLWLVDILFRCILTKGPLNIIDNPRKHKKPDIIGFGFNPTTGALFIRQKHMKGVGLEIDRNILDEVGKDYVVENCYIRNINNRISYHYFCDLKYEEELVQKNEMIDKLFEMINVSLVEPLGTSSIYIPALRNWAYSMTIPNVNNQNVSSLDQIIMRKRFSRYKNIDGMEIVYLTMLDKLFRDADKLPKEDATYAEHSKKNHANSAISQRAMLYFLHAKWIYNLILNPKPEESKIPEYVLSKEARYNYSKAFWEYDKKNSII